VKYIIVAVPGLTPVTTPELLIVATEVGVQLHDETGIAVVRAMDAPTHKGTFPMIGVPVTGKTVRTRVAVPHSVV
jgi:hypothetical protein